MKKSEIIEMLNDNIIVCMKQKESNIQTDNQKCDTYYDGKIYAFKLIRDVLFYMHIDDDMKTIPIFEK